MAVNISIGLSPSCAASAGTMGKSAGVTTPSVEAKSDMIAATTPKLSGTSTGGIVPPIQAASWSMVPALMATAISMPMPQIMISVGQGSDAMALRSSPSFSISAMTENTLAIRPMSILELMKAAVSFPGRARCASGAASTIAIIASVSHSVWRCLGSSGAGLSICISPCRPRCLPVTRSISVITTTGSRKVAAKIATLLTKAVLASIPALVISPRKMMPDWLDMKLAPPSAP